MVESTIPLPEVDQVKLTLLIDNSVDVLMAGTEVAKRFPLVPDLFDHPFPVAEHGFSALIHVRQGAKQGTILFDTGVSRRGILYNMDVMQINASDIQAIILSHGHADHAMGLPGLVDRLGSNHLPLVLHPDAYLERRLVLPNGTELFLRPPKKADFQRENIELIETVSPSMLVDDMILVSGEVARTTEFETGLRGHESKRNGHWEADPLIHDDQFAMMNVKNKGLVICTGCGHSGIINIIRHAQALTGIRQVYAVVGGFHLTGGQFEAIIPQTIAALKEINPRYVMPGHCTGWSATHQIARAMPEAFIANSVGTTLIL